MFLFREPAWATGVVIRGEQGQVIAAACKWYDYVPDSITAEAFAY